MPWSKHQLQTIYSSLAFLICQTPAMALCPNRALLQLVTTRIYRLIFQLSQGGSKCLHVDISCIFVIVQVAVLFLQDKLFLYSQRVFKKKAVNPIPAHELIARDILS